MEQQNYLVSARKFRPKIFKDVLGQEHITQTLKNAIVQNRLSHSSLFCGPRGVGKTTCARIFAKVINCENITAEGEPCDSCPACNSFNKNSSLNIFELDAASNNSVEDIRALNEQVKIRPLHGKYKVYIIDEVHMLSTGAFNAFLKTLEEPPSYVFFILATTEKNKILPTILSRCQIYDFKRITNQDILIQMEAVCNAEKYGYDKEALEIIASKSDGCMRDALSLMDNLAGLTNYNLTFNNIAQQLNILNDDFFSSFFKLLATNDIAELIHFIREYYQKGFEIESIIESLCKFLRDLLLFKTPNGETTFSNLERKNLLKSLSPHFSKEYLVSTINLLNDVFFEIKQVEDKLLFFELRLTKLAYLQDAIEFAKTSAEKKN